MAKLIWNGWDGFDLKNLNLYNTTLADSYDRTPTRLVVYYGNGLRDQFNGAGLKYGADGYPAAGIVTSYSLKDVGTIGSITGVKIQAATLAAAARTASTSDDRAIFKAALSKNDTLVGGEADDKLEGFKGKDKITGGWGQDKLYGGSGADTFIFRSSYDAAWENGGDVIYDFSKMQKDRIDLRGIDAVDLESGNQAFTFVGTQQFSGKAGELRYERVAGGIKIMGDTYGGGDTEFYIVLKGVSSISENYFLL